jgi:hypothetical protein
MRRREMVMGYIDVLIPGVIGLLLVALPTAFTKPTGDATVDGPRQKKLRIIGSVLLGVAALYLFIKLASGT